MDSASICLSKVNRDKEEVSLFKNGGVALAFNIFVDQVDSNVENAER